MTTVLFTGTPTVNDASDGAPGLSLGTRIEIGQNGRITGIRWRFPDTLPGDDIDWTLARYRPSDDTAWYNLATGTFASPSAGAYNTHTLTTDIPVCAGDELVPWVFTPDRYVATANFFTSTVVSGNIAGPQDDTIAVVHRNGRFNSGGTPTFPTSGFNATGYFVDIVYEDGGTETLFGATPTIGSANNTESTYTMATRVTFDVAGEIRGVRFWSASGVIGTGPVTGAVFDTTGGAALETKDFVNLSTGTWQTVLFDTPVHVDQGETKDIAVGPIDKYAATTNVFSSPLTVGNLTGTAGRFIANATFQFPTSTSTTWYGMDPIFIADGGQSIEIGLATELDIALPIDPGKSVDIGLATETNTAQSIAVLKTVTIGIAQELNIALPIVVEGGVVPGVATGSDLSAVYWANVLAGSLVVGTPSLSLRDALAVWASNTGNVTVLEILNVEAGNALPDWLAMQGVLNELAGTENLTVQNCLATLAA